MLCVELIGVLLRDLDVVETTIDGRASERLAVDVAVDVPDLARLAQWRGESGFQKVAEDEAASLALCDLDGKGRWA